jgi:CheY-like chemotaxis protein
MSRKILIVDDDVDLVDSLAQALIQNGYSIARAHSAGEGLRRLLAEKPDLVILDVMMETDTAGFEMAYQVRNRRTHSRYAEFRDVPIILLTAINQATNSRFSLNEKDSFLPNVNDFVTKPFRMDELIEKVKAALE